MKQRCARVCGNFDAVLAETADQVIQAKRFDENPPSSQYGPHYFVHYKGWKNTWDGTPVTTATHIFRFLHQVQNGCINPVFLHVMKPI